MPFTIKKIAMRLRNDSEYIPLPGVRGEAGPGVPAGGTTGQVLAKTSSTDYATGWVDAGSSSSLTILSYGISTWNDFITAYNSNSIVYCRASSAADPSSGSQTRLAFMAYVNSAASPTSVEFQYYRSVGTHTDAQQGDQVFIYKLTSAGAWTVTVREAYTKIVAGSNMTSSYANGTLTLNATGGGGTSDYDDLTDKPSINDVTLSGNKTAADLGLGTYSKPSGGIPQTDLASAVQSKLDNTVVVSDTQPTATENKLWVDTDAGAGSTYQVPTVAEMETADNTILGNLATIETSPTTASHVIGEYIVYNGQLYTVTASIAAGATLTVGTNIQAISASQIAQRIYHLAGGASVSLYHTMPVLIYTDRGGLWSTGQASSRGLATLVAYSGFTITLVDNSNLTITSGIPGGATIAVISSGYFYFY